MKATAFQCHKTVDYSDDERPAPGDRPQQCAGLMAVLHREKRPNDIMRVAERFNALDRSALDPRGEAYGSLAEVYEAHCRYEKGSGKCPSRISRPTKKSS